MMNRMLKAAIAIAITIAMMITATAQADVVMVVQSNTPDYQPGAILSSDSVIELADGDELMLATDSGEITLSGPYSGPPEASDSADEDSVFKALGDLLGKSSPDTSDLGAVRGSGDDDDDARCDGGPPEAWSLAVVSGERCVPANGEVSFWREDASQDSMLKVKRIATGEEAELAWVSGKHVVLWPESLQQANGETFSVRHESDIQSKNVTLIKMPEGIDSEVQTIAWLAAQGCGCQAQKIYEGLRR